MVNNTYGKRFSYLQKCTHVNTLSEKTCSKGITIYNGHSLMEKGKLQTTVFGCHTIKTFATTNKYSKFGNKLF